MLGACMIDGFGWFHDADYRRTWLFFDDIRYILPSEPTGSLWYSPALQTRIECIAEHLALDDSDNACIAEQARLDAGDETFVALCAQVPTRDIAYARSVVAGDAVARRLLGDAVQTSTSLALSYLLNRLNFCARMQNLIPVVGQPYASDMLVWKASQTPPALPWKRTGNRLAYAAFAAGLSLDFLDDANLVSIPIDRIADFKQRNQEILAASQKSILSVTDRFAKLPDSEEFPTALEQLRAEVSADRRKLDERAKQAWVEAGLRIAKKAMLSGGTLLSGGVLLNSLTTGLAASAIGAGAVIASELIDPLRQQMQKPSASASYLFRLGDLARDASKGR